MFMLGPLGFATPALLLALLALPLLWWLLRAVPPAPLRRLFPGIVLLLGLEDEDSETDRTPWWLLLLRLLAIAAMIIGFAGPVLNPDAASGDDTKRPLLVFLDNGWQAAPDWSARISRAEDVLASAARAGRLAAIAPASGPFPTGFKAASEVAGSLAGLKPVAWDVPFVAATEWAASLPAADIVWISDGVAHEDRAALVSAFDRLGNLRVMEPPAPRLALRPAGFSNGLVDLTALRSQPGAASQIMVQGFGPGPGGVERELARLPLDFDAGATMAEARLSLPPEIRNRITRFAVEGQASAGAVTLADDSLRRRRVGLVGPVAGREGLELLSPLHYLGNALEPTAELLDGDLPDLIRASADVIILADIANLTPPDEKALAEWVGKGGLLLRFAGPRLAAADTGRGLEDVLLPVRLRAGGRVVGGAMSWGAPRAIAPFAANSPFYGLTIPDEVTVSAQVLAEPGPELADRTIAALADGTPLVTRKALGDGQVVLFHVTANAEWSGLPLSGLFVDMLERLAVSTRAARPDDEALAGTTWQAVSLLDGFGVISPPGALAPIPGEALSQPASASLPPGLYADDARRIAINATNAETVLAPAEWPAGVTPGWDSGAQARDISGWMWLLAFIALGLDILATLALSGRMPRGGIRKAAIVLLAAGLIPSPATTWAESNSPVNDALIAAASQVTLAHVLTGDAEVDRVAAAGLMGLSDELFRRTTVEPATPVGIDLEKDELSVYPFLYWPVTATQKLPSAEAYARLSAYLRAGGMVLFDTRDANVAGFGTSVTPAASRLRLLAAPLDIPPLEPVPEDHVLTRTFYLLQSFPGRHSRGTVWVEAAPADAELAEGMPFRNLNDGVTPVVIGGNDWASAWAVMPNGAPMFPVGHGRTGARQREMAYRFGVNLVMHVLTGNYKSDQVHVPALLERLGQ